MAKFYIHKCKFSGGGGGIDSKRRGKHVVLHLKIAVGETYVHSLKYLLIRFTSP